MSVLRDAIEDWEVLFLLERATEKAAAEAADGTAGLVRDARELLRVLPEITTDLTHWSTDPEVYLAWRHRAYHLLAGLRTSIGGGKLDLYVQEWERQRRAFLEESFQERVQAVLGTHNGNSINP